MGWLPYPGTCSHSPARNRSTTALACSSWLGAAVAGAPDAGASVAGAMVCPSLLGSGAALARSAPGDGGSKVQPARGAAQAAATEPATMPVAAQAALLMTVRRATSGVGRAAPQVLVPSGHGHEACQARTRPNGPSLAGSSARTRTRDVRHRYPDLAHGTGTHVHQRGRDAHRAAPTGDARGARRRDGGDRCRGLAGRGPAGHHRPDPTAGGRPIARWASCGRTTHHPLQHQRYQHEDRRAMEPLQRPRILVCSSASEDSPGRRDDDHEGGSRPPPAMQFLPGLPVGLADHRWETCTSPRRWTAPATRSGPSPRGDLRATGGHGHPYREAPR